MAALYRQFYREMSMAGIGIIHLAIVGIVLLIMIGVPVVALGVFLRMQRDNDS